MNYSILLIGKYNILLEGLNHKSFPVLNYYKKVEFKMNENINATYEFEGYYVDAMTDGTFEFYKNNDDYIGVVATDDAEQYAQDLSDGYDMIRNKTEDGTGNTLTFDGWE